MPNYKLNINSAVDKADGCLLHEVLPTLLGTAHTHSQVDNRHIYIYIDICNIRIYSLEYYPNFDC